MRVQRSPPQGRFGAANTELIPPETLQPAQNVSPSTAQIKRMRDLGAIPKTSNSDISKNSPTTTSALITEQCILPHFMSTNTMTTSTTSTASSSTANSFGSAVTTTTNTVSTIVFEKTLQSNGNSLLQFSSNDREKHSNNNSEHMELHSKNATPLGNSELNSKNGTPVGNLAKNSKNATPKGKSATQSKTTKRQRSSPEKLPQLCAKQQKLSNYWLSNTTSNRFSILDDEEEPEKSDTQLPEVVPKPPPIFITGVANIQPLRELLIQLAGNDFQLKVYSTDEVRVQPKTEQIYSIITKALAERDTQFHTYKLKSERSFDVVLRGVHPSTPVNEIKAEIEQLGHEVLNLSNMKHRTSKAPMPLFWINLKTNSNNKDIYRVNTILNTKITFEPPKKKREIPQCTRCQRYNHTKKFCHHPPRCVKCTGEHLTSNCARKTKGEGVKCVLCGDEHPANYKGCTVYKELQQKHYPTLRQRNPITNNSTEASGSRHVPGISYADATKATSTDNINPADKNATNTNSSSATDIAELKSMMKTLIEQMGTMLNLITALINKK